MTDDRIVQIYSLLDELEEEDISSFLRERFSLIRTMLSSSDSLSLRIDRVRSILDELDEESDIDSFIRSQLWRISVCIESL